MVHPRYRAIDSVTPEFPRLGSGQAQPRSCGHPGQARKHEKRAAEAAPGKLLFLRLRRLRGSNCRPSLADLEASKAAYGNVLAQLADLRCNELCDGDGLVLDKGLFQ